MSKDFLKNKAILKVALEDMSEVFSTIAELNGSDGERDAWSEAVAQFQEMYQAILDTLSESDAMPVFDVVHVYQDFIKALFSEHAETGLSDEALELLDAWQLRFDAVLNAPSLSDWSSWIKCLASPVWSNPFDEETIGMLVDAVAEWSGVNAESEVAAEAASDEVNTTSSELAVVPETNGDFQIDTHLESAKEAVAALSAGEIDAKSRPDFLVEQLEKWSVILVSAETELYPEELCRAVGKYIFAVEQIMLHPSLFTDEMVELIVAWHDAAGLAFASRGDDFGDAVEVMQDSAWPCAEIEESVEIVTSGDAIDLCQLDAENETVCGSNQVQDTDVETESDFEAVSAMFETSSEAVSALANGEIDADAMPDFIGDQISLWTGVSASLSGDAKDVVDSYVKGLSDYRDSLRAWTPIHGELVAAWHEAFQALVESRGESIEGLVEVMNDEAWGESFSVNDTEESVAVEEAVVIDESIVAENAGKQTECDFSSIEDNFNKSIETVEAVISGEIDMDSLSDWTGEQIEVWTSIRDALVDGEAVSSVSRYLEAMSAIAEEPRLMGSVVSGLVSEWHEVFALLIESECADVRDVMEIMNDEGWPKAGDKPLEAEELLVAVTGFESDVASSGADAVIELLSQEVHPVMPMLVSMIKDEFIKVADMLTDSLSKFNKDSIEVYQSSLGEKDFDLENIDKACNTVGLFGLSFVFRKLAENVKVKPREGHNYNEECNLFGIGILLIKEYFTEVDNKNRCESLVKHLMAPGWRAPLEGVYYDMLVKALQTPLQREEDIVIEKIVATEADVTLAIPNDVNEDLLNSLLIELPTLTQKFSAAVHAIVKNGDTTRLLEAQRVAHTLKGAGNTIGIRGIATLTHRLEDIFEALTDANRLPNKALGKVFVESVDMLEAMSDFLRNEGDEPEGVLEMLQTVLDWDYQIKTQGIPESDEGELEVKTEVARADKPQEAAVEKKDDAQTQAITTVASSIIDHIIQMSGESVSLNDRIQEKVNQLTDFVKLVHEMSWKIHELSGEMDRLVNIQSYTSRAARSAGSDFDALEMDQYSELHTCISRLAEVSSDVREFNGDMRRELVNTKNLLIEQQSVQRENTEIAQNIRLVPVSKVVTRCQRIVRQACKMVNKEVNLMIIGENTLVDNEILNDLMDPLMHLLRNSVDHGIELPEVRKQRGKPETGEIILTFSKSGNYIHVTCEDDGGGLNREKILASAIEKGLVSKDKHLGIDEIDRLILLPGFSTKDVTTQLSGRGIGMDAIQSKISNMKGVMDLSSEPGFGLNVNIVLPANTSSTQAVLVRDGGSIYAIAEHGVQRIFASVAGKVRKEGDSFRYSTDEGEDFECFHLATLLGLPMMKEDDYRFSAIQVRDKNNIDRVVLVEGIAGSSTLMIRQLGQYLVGVNGILGGAILGSGNVSPVVDLFELLSNMDRLVSERGIVDINALRKQIKQLKVMVVDDSLSARKAAAQLMEDSGFEVRTAIDGLDAIEKIDAEHEKPSIMLVDMEMPRMNGVELTAHIRTRTDMAGVPIIMITSRSTDKHRQQAKEAGVSVYLTKPFTEDDLMENVNMLLQDA